MKVEKNKIQLRIITGKNHIQNFGIIIYHPMETGYRKNSRLETIPADYIEYLRISVDDKHYIEYTLGAHHAKNPLLTFDLVKPIASGQTLKLYWRDNNNIETRYALVVKFDKKNRFYYRNFEYPKKPTTPRRTDKKKATLKHTPPKKESTWSIEFGSTSTPRQPSLIDLKPNISPSKAPRGLKSK